MSPHNVNNFVSDLVLMAKAMEELPQAQALVKSLQDENFGLLDKVQDRELKIIELKDEIEKHLSSIRTLEVARDDAELRFLELEETSNMVRRALNEISDSARNQARQITVTLEKANPTPPEPVPTTQPIEAEAIYRVGGQDMGHGWPIAGNGNGDPNMGHGSSEPTPSSDQGSSASPLPQSESWAGTTIQDSSHSNANSQTATASGDTVSATDPTSGHSEADPTAAATSNETGNSVISSGANEVGNVSQPSTTDTSMSSGKYHGKLYEDHPYYVSYDAWIAGGGSDFDYHFRKPIGKDSVIF